MANGPFGPLMSVDVGARVVTMGTKGPVLDVPTATPYTFAATGVVMTSPEGKWFLFRVSRKHFC
jgi:hypothetical protein